jgi:hypothetical protein
LFLTGATRLMERGIEPMATEQPSKSTRRAVLTGAVAGLGVWAVGAVGRANPALADGEAIQIGGDYASAMSRTALTNETNNETVWYVYNSHRGTALYALSNSGIGVNAISNFDSGLYAVGKPAITADPSGRGYAIVGKGRVRLERISGVAVIAAGRTNVRVTPGVDLNTGSFVLLTPRSNLKGRDLWYRTDPQNERFTIHISTPRTAATRVSWLLLD